MPHVCGPGHVVAWPGGASPYALHLPAVFEPAEDVDDFLSCRVLGSCVACQEKLGYEQVRYGGISLAHHECLWSVVEADHLVPVDRGEPAGDVEGIGAPVVAGSPERPGL